MKTFIHTFIFTSTISLGYATAITHDVYENNLSKQYQVEFEYDISDELTIFSNEDEDHLCFFEEEKNLKKFNNPMKIFIRNDSISNLHPETYIVKKMINIFKKPYEKFKDRMNFLQEVKALMTDTMSKNDQKEIMLMLKKMDQNERNEFLDQLNSLNSFNHDSNLQNRLKIIKKFEMIPRDERKLIIDSLIQYNMDERDEIDVFICLMNLQSYQRQGFLNYCKNYNISPKVIIEF